MEGKLPDSEIIRTWLADLCVTSLEFSLDGSLLASVGEHRPTGSALILNGANLKGERVAPSAEQSDFCMWR